MDCRLLALLKGRINEEVIFKQVRKEVETLGSGSRSLCLALDDTILRKVGKRIPGTAYRKDPLGPAFNVNLVWAQRRLQFSAAVADKDSEVRMIPICFEDASTPRKPRQNATPELIQNNKEQMKQRNLNALAIENLCRLQQERADENQGITSGRLSPAQRRTQTLYPPRLPDLHGS